jgi:hypothetical protein
MAIHATVAFCDNEFVAELSDGRQLARPDFRAMAEALVHARVRASEVQYEWKSGQRMITIGQQVALLAEMRRLEREYVALSIAA